MRLLEQTAPHVSAFTRNMKLGRLEAGLFNLDQINDLLTADDKAKAIAAQQNGASDESD